MQALAGVEPLSHWDAAALQAHSVRAALAFRVPAAQVVSAATLPVHIVFGGSRRARRQLQNTQEANSLVVARAGGLNASHLEAAYAGWAELAPSAYAASLHFNVTALAAPAFKQTSTLVAPPPPPPAAEPSPAWLWAALGCASALLLCATGLAGFRLVLARRRGRGPAPVAPHQRSADEEPRPARTSPPKEAPAPPPAATPPKAPCEASRDITSY